MALDMLDAMTSHFFTDKDIEDNVFDTNPVLKRLKSKAKSYDGGVKISIGIESAESATGSFYTGAEVLNTSSSDFATRAEFEWRQAHVPISYTMRDFLINKSSKARLVDLVDSQMKNAQKVMQALLTTALFATSKGNAKNIEGFVASGPLAAGSTSWGGLTSSNITDWTPGVRDTTTTKVTHSLLDSTLRTCNDGSDQVTMLVTTDTVANLIYNILTDAERFVNTSAGNLGFKTINIQGVPIITDKNATASYIYFINEDHIWLAYHEDRLMKMETPGIPVNQDARVKHLLFMGNLVGNSRRRSGVLTAITS